MPSDQHITQALALASNDCRGSIQIEHVEALRSLATRGLVRLVLYDYGAFYRITPAGRAELARRKVLQ